MSVAIINTSIFDSPAGEVDEVAERRITLAQALAKRVVVLGVDSPVSVPLDGLTNVGVVHCVPQDGAAVTMRLTSGAGSQQLVPVDDLATIISRSVPFTAIDLIRVAGQATTVHLFLGQKA